MRIYGIDFTSAPTRRKPITVAVAELDGSTLRFHAHSGLESFDDFAAFLATPGPWTAGIDFPFSLPRPFIQSVGWPDDWSAMVSHVGSLTIEQFVGAVRSYRGLKGERELRRDTDSRASSCSPMKVFYTPVGRMFYRGAPLLAASGVRVVPMSAHADNREVVEAYPALVARSLIDRESYKSDDRKRQTAARESARVRAIEGMVGGGLRAVYDLNVAFDFDAMELNTPSGDSLDAVFAAIQAAWFVRQNRQHLLESCDILEGNIIDPKTIAMNRSDSASLSN